MVNVELGHRPYEKVSFCLKRTTKKNVILQSIWGKVWISNSLFQILLLLNIYMVKLLNQTPTAKKQNIISTLAAPCAYFKFTNPITTTSGHMQPYRYSFTTTCFFTLCLRVIHADARFFFSLLYCILLYEYPHFIQTYEQFPILSWTVLV